MIAAATNGFSIVTEPHDPGLRLMLAQTDASTLPQPALSATRTGFNASTLTIAAVVTVVAGLLYFFTVARDIVVGDTPELITAAATLGVPHPPGYPLFTMLGHLFSVMPVGSTPFRVNLLAVACDALTVGVTFLTALRLSRSRLAAAAAALMLAVVPNFWTWSLAAEVFPLNNLLASVLICLLVTWHEEPQRRGVLIAAFFVAGLALTNHHTVVLLAPSFCFVLWTQRAVLRTRPQLLAIGIAVFCVGLLPYAYVPWASAHHPAWNWGNVSSLHDVVALIARKSYGSHRLVGVTSYMGGSPFMRILALCISFGPMAGILILLGAVQAYRRLRWYFWFSLIAFFCAGPLFAWISNLNLATAPSAIFVLQRFFLLPLVVVAPLMALGIVLVAEIIERAVPASIRTLMQVTGVLLIVVVMSALTNYRRLDQSHNRIAHLYGEDIFDTVAPHSILLVTGDGTAIPLTYLSIVERKRPDVALVLSPLLPADWYLRQLRERYPDLVIPFDQYDGQQHNLQALIEANPGRPAAAIGPLPDRSLEGHYWAYQYGLVSVVEPSSKRFTLSEMASDNEQLMKRYHPPSSRSINRESFESEILASYAQPAAQVAHEYERRGFKEEARAWYRRAQAIDPNLPQVRGALAKLDRE
jgi:4-amino-4-deoxy-L-arabinose transferase-like glycosyltransferase